MSFLKPAPSCPCLKTCNVRNAASAKSFTQNMYSYGEFFNH